MAALAVVLIRFLLPFTILRWPFWGAILAILGDISDVVLMDAFGWGWFEGRDYHTYDKLFDTYYLGFEVYMALKWQEVLARRTAVFLFSWRLLGIIAFEIFKIRQLVFLAPNIFENFYLLVVGLRKFFGFKVDRMKRLIILLLVAGIPKIAQEYIMHYLEFPTWPFLKKNLFRWG
ncbi:MAG: hypothetical protein ABH889_01945 [Candidatus Portnoybacteria bacterium]